MRVPGERGIFAGRFNTLPTKDMSVQRRLANRLQGRFFQKRAADAEDFIQDRHFMHPSEVLLLPQARRGAGRASAVTDSSGEEVPKMERRFSRYPMTSATVTSMIGSAVGGVLGELATRLSGGVRTHTYYGLPTISTGATVGMFAGGLVGSSIASRVRARTREKAARIIEEGKKLDPAKVEKGARYITPFTGHHQMGRAEVAMRGAKKELSEEEQSDIKKNMALGTAGGATAQVGRFMSAVPATAVPGIGLSYLGIIGDVVSGQRAGSKAREMIDKAHA